MKNSSNTIIKSRNNIAESQNRILKFITEEERITTTSEVAEKIGLAWNTAEKRLLELALDGKILRIKKEGVNLWTLK